MDAPPPPFAPPAAFTPPPLDAPPPPPGQPPAVAAGRRTATPFLIGCLGAIVGAALVVGMLVVGFLVVRLVQASRPPAGYTLWRGLLLPDYFVLRGEEPSGRPDGSDAWGPGPCTRATFYHGLTDYSQAMQQMWGQWQRRGITLTRQSPQSAGYYYRKPSGGTVLVIWLSTGVGKRHTMTIWDCPREALAPLTSARCARTRSPGGRSSSAAAAPP